MSLPAWLEEIKGAGLQEVASALGLQMQGKGLSPCPSCRADKRSASERRAPVGLDASGGWKCHACGLSGDAIDLLCASVHGRRWRDLSPSEKEETRSEALRLGLCRETDQPTRPLRLAAPTGRSSNRPASKPPARVAGEEIPEARDSAPAVRIDGLAWPIGSFPTKLPWSPDLPLQLADRLWADPAAEPVRKYLTGGAGEGPGGCDGRNLSEAACRAWKLGAHQDGRGVWWVSIPYRDKRGKYVNCKYRRLPNPDNSTDKPRYVVMEGLPLVLFGAKSLPLDAGAVVMVVEGELDVVAAHDLGRPVGVVSGTAGADQAWPDEWLDLLDGYRHVVIATDDDEPGDRAAAALSKSLGPERCSRAKFLYKDLGECLQRGVDEEEIDIGVERAEPFIAVKVRSIGEFRSQILAGKRDPKQVIGLPTGSPGLDSLFGGWPHGLTVITGGEGVGKSTFATWALWEQALNGVPGLITSFENDVIPAFHKMIRMKIGGDIFEAPERVVDAAIDEIDRMPIRVVDHYGLMPLDQLLETIRYSIRRHGTKIVLIDHLGFMIDTSREDTTRQIDHIVRQLVTLGRSEKISILLIAHPKEKESKGKGRVTTKDLKGATSIRQDMAVGLVLEQHPTSKVPATIVHCDKQRGEWGAGSGSSTTLYFHPKSCLFAGSWDLLLASVDSLSDGWQGGGRPHLQALPPDESSEEEGLS